MAIQTNHKNTRKEKDRIGFEVSLTSNCILIVIVIYNDGHADSEEKRKILGKLEVSFNHTNVNIFYLLLAICVVTNYIYLYYIINVYFNVP